MTPDEQVEAVRAALAEAGYPDAHVEFGTMSDGNQGLLLAGAPLSEQWRALAICGPVSDGSEGNGCWPCYQHRGTTAGCTHDYLSEPWPEVTR